MIDALSEIKNFLACQTPTAWLAQAAADTEILLIDHAHCEKKAALSALSLIHSYPQYYELLHKMSALAREELRHFEQVLTVIQNRHIKYCHLEPSRYAASLKKQIASSEPEKLIDTLIVGSIIEARSCERFALLIPILDAELSLFYTNLVKAEARHFQDYLKLATKYANSDITGRIAFFTALEAELITTIDEQFRFHSGMPKIAKIS